MSALLSSVAEAALRAVLGARTLPEAHGAARDGLDALATASPLNVVELGEARELSGWSAGHLRKMAAAHRLGMKWGGRWILFRDRLVAHLRGGAG